MTASTHIGGRCGILRVIRRGIVQSSARILRLPPQYPPGQRSIWPRATPKGFVRKVIVPGAGIIGVTQGRYLAQAGHEVTVIDRQMGPALETSFTNAGEVSPGYSAP